MSKTTTAGGRIPDDDLCTLFGCFANSDRRQLLRMLYEQAPDPVSERDLASRLARHGDSRGRVSEQGVRDAETALHHTHLPQLEAAGLVERDQNAVTISDHPAFRDPGICDVLETDADDESLDALFGGLVEKRHRTILDVLSHQFHPIHVETLAREVGAKERGTSEQAVPPERVRQILVELHHVHLPKLVDAGLVSTDDEGKMVEYEGHPKLRVAWMHSALGPDFRTSLTGESEIQELGTIDGREAVISYGQSLGERADEELFCMFTHKDMLEAGCFARLLAASRRGVDVYLGTCDPTVREFVREHAPDIVLWEPETDWLNLPVDGNRVGRLVLCDREAVMLATLEKKTDDGMHEEKAIIGDGADNTLVVMIRQMLSHHLEEIDAEVAEAGPCLSF